MILLAVQLLQLDRLGSAIIALYKGSGLQMILRYCQRPLLNTTVVVFLLVAAVVSLTTIKVQSTHSASPR